MTFVSDIKVHGSINPEPQGYEVVRETKRRAKGQTRTSYSLEACQLACSPEVPHALSLLIRENGISNTYCSADGLAQT